jgi:putative transposase
MVLSTWRLDYDTVRPHSKLGGRTPAEFAEQHVPGHAQGHVAIISTINHERAGLYS